MTTVLIDYRGTYHENSEWNLLANGAIANAVASDGVTLTGWSIDGTFGLPAGTSGASTTTGDAAWVNPSVVSVGSRLQTVDGVYAENTVSGLNNSKLYIVECFSSIGGFASRSTLWRVNGTTQDLAGSDASSVANATNTVVFPAVAPVSGVITIGFTNTPGTPIGVANAVRIVELAGPELTLDDAAFEPGKAITGTYANYAAAPTVVTLTDSAGNTLTPAVTINDTAKTFSTAYPARITTGSGTTLLRGPVTLELT